MKRFVSFLLFFIFLSSAVWGETYTWIGNAEGGDGVSWEDADNWETSSDTPAENYPGENDTNDDAIIGNYTVKINTSIDNALASLTINGGTLEIENGGSLEADELTINDGTLDNNGSITVTNVTITSTNGTISNLDIVSGDVSITTTGSSNVTIGTITTNGTIDLTVGGTGTLNAVSNTYDTVTISEDTTLAANLSTANLIVNNTLNLSSHTLGVTDSLTIGSGAVLTLNNDLNVTTVTNDGTLNLGSHNITATTIDNNGTLSLVGNTGQLLGGTHTSIGGTVEFTGSGTTLSGITDFTNLIINGGNRTGAGTLLVSGNFELNVGTLNATSLAVTGTSTISGNITTTGDTQNYGGAVTLGAGVTLTGSTVTLGEITGGNHSLTITGDAVLNGGSGINGLSVSADAVFSTATLTASSVTVSGAAALDANITTTGVQTYTGDVTLGADVTLTSGSTVTIHGTVTGNSNSLTIDGTAALNAVNGLTDLIVTGNSTINGDITTSGNQTYSGTVTLGGTGTLYTLTSGSTVTIGGTVTGNSNSLTIDGTAALNVVNGLTDLIVTENSTISGNITTSGDQTYSGTVTLGGAGTLYTLTSGSTVTIGGTVTGNSKSLTITGNAVLNGGGSGIGALHITGTGTINAAITATASVSVDGTAALDADINTSGIQQYGTVTLGTNVTLTGSTVTLGAVTSGNHSLTIDGNATLNVVNGLTGLTVTGNSTISGNITTSGDQTYSGTVTLGADVILTGSHVTLGAIIGGNHSLTITGDATLNAVNGLTDLTVTGNSTISGDINTSGNQTYSGTVALGGTGTRKLESTGGTITTTGLVSAPSNSVTIKAGGDITIGSGGITASTGTNGVIRLESGADININGDIEGYQLVAIANSASGLVTVDAEIVTSSNGIHFEEASIYVSAKTFSVASGSSIIPGTSGQLCLMVDTQWTNLYTVVPVDRWHQHREVPISNKHVVYSTGINPPPDYDDGDLYHYINSTDSANVNTLIRVGGDHNIYIIDVTDNVSGVSLIIESSSGVIEIHGEYTTTSPSLTPSLEPGDGGIKLVDADITLTGIHFDTNGKKVTLAGSSGNSITVANITLGEVDGTGDLTLNASTAISIGAVGTSGTHIGDLTINGSAGVTLSGDIFANDVTTGAGLVSSSGNVAINATGEITIGSGGIDIDGNLTLSSPNTSTINGDITTGGSQTYNDDVTLGGNGARKLEATGGAITTTGLVDAPNGVTINAHGDITIGSGGITAGTSTVGVIRLESGGDITVDGAVAGYQLIAIADGNSVTIGASVTIETHSNGSEGVSASMYVNAENFVVSNNTADSIIPGSIGQLCLNLANLWADSNGAVKDARWHQHYHMSIPITQNLVYGTGPNSGPYTDGNGNTITNFVYVDSTNTDIINDVFSVSANYNIYIINVGTTSREVTFGVTGSGVIEIQGNYTSSSNLTLQPGSGGIRLSNANINLTGSFNTNASLALTGTNNSITAASVNLGGTVSGVGNFTVKTTSGNIATAGINTGTNGIIRLESGGNITLDGTVTGYQLIAITDYGTVTVGSINIHSSNTGSEEEDAAIYIEASSFNPIGGPNSIHPGGVNGQLCLKLVNTWTDNGAVDGAENVRWHQEHLPKIFKILYSFTEDEDGNGKLDRIRVQTSVALTGDFSDFRVSVTGYEVKGFDMVDSSSDPDNDSFYIYLKENDTELDGGNTPRWSVMRNEGSLKCAKTNTIIGNPLTDKDITPIDTIPPRIAYTLTLPGHPQTYVQMSEPVDSTAATLKDSFAIGGTYNINSVSSKGSLGYLLDLNASFEVDTLVELKNITNSIIDVGYFSVENMKDRSTAAVPADPDDPLPKYPANWGYTAYAVDSGSNVFVPPHSLIDNTVPLNLITPANPAATVIRRVTDVLVSIPPSGDDDNYFAWPVWAKNEKGTIGIFNGTAFLEDGAVELQANINQKLAGSSLEIFLPADDVSSNYRNPMEMPVRAKSVGGLWLPEIANPLYYYVQPTDANKLNPVSVNLRLYNFMLGSNESGRNIEFIFRVNTASNPNSDMFAARLDAPVGANLYNLDWWKMIRPFGFYAQNIRPQRGGVTIMNNVINSDAGETVNIRYHLVRPGRVTIQVYTLEGTLVYSIRRNEHREAGVWTDSWNGSNNAGRPVARGMYFVRIVGPDIDEIRKIMVIR